MRILFVLVIVAFFLALMTPFPRSRRPSDRMLCQNSLRHIGMAMRQYHDDYGCYPPAFVTDSEGTAIHSWRVLLFPYLIHAKFSEYRFDEPWNGPNNILLLGENMYRCPSATNKLENCTNYVAVTGPGTVFEGSHGRRDDEITGDPSKIIMLVEIADSDIPWTAPRDLNIETMSLTIGADRHGISSNHPNGINVLFCSGQNMGDGTTSRDGPRAEFLESSISAERLKSMLQLPQNEHRQVPH